MTHPRISSSDSPAVGSGRFARAARFAKACGPRFAVVALPVALVCGQQFWWALVVAVVAAVIELIRYLRSPPFMRIRLEPRRRDD
jgi:uncharacterized membrane protein YfbV (UPF0208 family)